MLRAATLFMLIALSACGATQKLAKPRGPVFPLNADRWSPAPNDLRQPPEIVR